jgi:hypothetical protein
MMGGIFIGDLKWESDIATQRHVVQCLLSGAPSVVGAWWELGSFRF